MTKFKKYYTLFIDILIIFNIMCIKKTSSVLARLMNSTDVSQVSISQHMLQENDILKIDVTSLEMKASIPYNKFSLQGNATNSLDLMQLNGYLVSNNKTINSPVLGEISVLIKHQKI